MVVTKYFAICFDEPNEHWLCPDNLKIALESYCTNTKFKIIEIKDEVLESEVQRRIETKGW